MKTLKITEARANLGQWCERAKKGDLVGIICGDQILQLKPIEVVPWEETYAYKEYGVTHEEMEQFASRMTVKMTNDRRRGKFRKFSGDIEKDIRD